MNLASNLPLILPARAIVVQVVTRADRSSSTKLIDRPTSSIVDPVSKREKVDRSQKLPDSQLISWIRVIVRTGAVGVGGRMPSIRSSSANIQIGRSPSGHIVPL
ncbi:hypothetical protein Fot_12288 [Forsythia ovata]|uniref:Secreted protein n=1 Tax=Forsythia ovata TaxID=205694 RepID=A0ABD1WPZ9_9LAMI